MQDTALFHQIQTISTSIIPCIHRHLFINIIVLSTIVICVVLMVFVRNLMKKQLKQNLGLLKQNHQMHKLLNRCGFKRYNFMRDYLNIYKTNICWHCDTFTGNISLNTLSSKMWLNMSVIMSGKLNEEIFLHFFLNT